MIKTHVGQAPLPRTIRPAFYLFVATTLLLAPSACRRKRAQAGTDEEAPRMMSVLSLADPKTEPQLVKGFYGVEAGAWRWTEKQFAVVLRTPPGAAQKGGKLTFKLTVPPVTAEKLRAVSLSANVGGTALQPETYTTPGDYSYVRDLPPSVFTGDSVRVDFQLDKAMPPNPPDIRELGVIAFNVGLESK